MSNKQNDIYHENKREFFDEEKPNEMDQKEMARINEINYMKGFNRGINKAIEIVKNHHSADLDSIERKLMLVRHFDF